MGGWGESLWRRPLLCAALGLVAGVLSAPLWPWAGRGLGPLLAGLAALPPALALWARGRRVGAAALFFLAGALLGLGRAQPWLGRLESPPGPGQWAWVTGQVRESMVLPGAGERRALVLEKVRVAAPPGTPPRTLPGGVRVAWQARPGEPSLAPGDEAGLVGLLRSPGPPRNPGEFDYRSYLAGQGITAQAWPRHGSGPRLLKQGGFWNWRRLAWDCREALVGSLRGALPADPAASPDEAPAWGIVAAMVFGDRRGIPAAEREAFSKSGLSYLLAVAGLHLELALALFLKALSWFTPGRRRRAAWSLALVGAYAAVTGLQTPALRAASLLLLVLLARLADLETDFPTSLAFGALVVLLASPAALFEAGFQFSFAVTLAIVLFAGPFKGRIPTLGSGRGRTALALAAGLLAVTLAVQLAVVPVEAFQFHQFSYPSLLSNLVGGLFLAPILLLGLAVSVTGLAFPGAASLAGHALGWMALALRACTRFLAGLPLAALSTGRPSWAWLAAWALGAWLLWNRLAAAPRRERPRAWAWLAGPALLGLCLALLLRASLPHRHPGLTKAWFLDVGQGDCTLVEFGDGRTLLVDAGPERPDAGSWVVVPALRFLGISRLDWVVSTHPDADHLGGLPWVLEHFPVGKVLDSGLAPRGSGAAGRLSGLWARYRALLRTGRFQVEVPRAGRRQPADEAGRWTVLNPAAALLRGTRDDTNNNSLVLRVGDWLLLQADVERRGEAAMLKSFPPGRVALLKVGHHGSDTATGRPLLGAVRPRAALIQAGWNNGFGFPKAGVLSRLKAAGCALYRTDLQGCVCARRSASGLEFGTWGPAGPPSLWKAPPSRRARRPARAADGG